MVIHMIRRGHTVHTIIPTIRLKDTVEAKTRTKAVIISLEGHNNQSQGQGQRNQGQQYYNEEQQQVGESHFNTPTGAPIVRPSVNWNPHVTPIHSSYAPGSHHP
jgi:hypothetical protein